MGPYMALSIPLFGSKNGAATSNKIVRPGIQRGEGSSRKLGVG